MKRVDIAEKFKSRIDQHLFCPILDLKFVPDQGLT